MNYQIPHQNLAQKKKTTREKGNPLLLVSHFMLQSKDAFK